MTTATDRRAATDILLGAGACALGLVRWSTLPIRTATLIAVRVTRGTTRDRLAAALAARGGLLRRRLRLIAEATLPVVLRPVLEAVLDAVDLTTLVREHLDLNELVSDVDLEAVVVGIDLDAIIHRIDLAALASEVINVVDLPRIVRESSETIASETVQDMRTECARADDAVARLVDRLLRRGPAPNPAPR
ncbi:MAG: hypothetical protein ACJ72N_06190 [Labedaea sp.]